MERPQPVAHLNSRQLHRLTEAFRDWRERAATSYTRRVRGRYWLAFLFLRHTGARIGEVLRIDDLLDINCELHEILIHAPASKAPRSMVRSVPVPRTVISEIMSYRDEFPVMRGRVLALDQGNFRREFYRRAAEAEIPRPLSHPHILRHTRAMELVEAGVPLNTVRQLLGHVLSSSTAVYLRHQDVAVRWLLEEKGLL